MSDDETRMAETENSKQPKWGYELSYIKFQPPTHVSIPWVCKELININWSQIFLEYWIRVLIVF